MLETKFYEKLEGKKVKCGICHHRCVICPSQRGICGVRENRGGKLFSLNYGKMIAINVDPIEKKPLFHFLPGSRSYSIATVGCNFCCQWCQNHDISQYPKKNKVMIGEDFNPREIVEEAKKIECETISYTYTEPTIFFEFAYETMILAKKEGIKNVWVSNGFMSEKVLSVLDGLLDAANIDLKGFSEGFYQKYCGAKLRPVLDNLVAMKKKGIWLEITTLLIPGLNDNEEELKWGADFIKKELGDDVPWHVTAFHPDYLLLDLPSTPVSTLLKAREIGLKTGLKYVYAGNVLTADGETTFCSKCGEKVIERAGFAVERLDEEGKCRKCGEKVAGVW